MPLNFDLALEYTKMIHEGQFRNNGDPYWTHPHRVALASPKFAEDAARRFNIRGMDIAEWPKSFAEEVGITCLFHDGPEDQPKRATDSFLKEILKEIGCTADQSIRIMASIKALTKVKSATFDIVEYLHEIKQYPIAWAGKHADLEDNLSDLKPGSLRNSYRLAQEYLNAP